MLAGRSLAGGAHQVSTLLLGVIARELALLTVDIIGDHNKGQCRLNTSIM